MSFVSESEFFIWFSMKILFIYNPGDKLENLLNYLGSCMSQLTIEKILSGKSNGYWKSICFHGSINMTASFNFCVSLLFTSKSIYLRVSSKLNLPSTKERNSQFPRWIDLWGILCERCIKIISLLSGDMDLYAKMG